MKKPFAASVVAAVLALGLSGCSKDADCEAFMTENSAFAATVRSAHEKDGVDGARKAFDGKKDDLKKKWEGIKDARGFQVTDETMKKLADNLAAVRDDICGLADDQLCTDYRAIINE